MANEGITKYTVQESNNLKLGQLGFDLISEGDGAQTGNWVAVYNPDAAAILVDLTLAIGDSVTALSLCSNGVIYGQFTTVECETGGKSLIAYRG